MGARQKLNGVYVSACTGFAALVGMGFGSWWGFGAAFAAAVGVQVLAGNIRPTAVRR